MVHFAVYLNGHGADGTVTPIAGLVLCGHQRVAGLARLGKAVQQTLNDGKAESMRVSVL